MDWLTVLNLTDPGNCDFIHSYLNLFIASAVTTREPTNNVITLGIADAAPAWKLMSLCNASIVQPVGMKFCSPCIHGGVTSIGHQHPPSAAS